MQISETAFWKSLASPVRRSILDILRTGPKTTSQLDERFPELSRYAVMQHLRVLVDADLVLIRRRGRERFNHLNAVPLRLAYERWVSRFEDSAATEALGIARAAGTQMSKGNLMSAEEQNYRVVRIENALRFQATPEKVFDVLTRRSREWFPMSAGGERTQAVVLEPKPGGMIYEEWEGGAGHCYGYITRWDPPLRLAMRTQLSPGTIMDTDYSLRTEGADTVFETSRVIAGPISEDEVQSFKKHGDFNNFERILRQLIEGEKAEEPSSVPRTAG